MHKKSLISIVLFISVTLLLLPNFYRNRWSAVEPGYYAEWQTRYDRMVVARLVETRQHGFFSSGGLMGLGDVDEIGYDTRTSRHQFNTFLNNGTFKSYWVYESNPGFQAIFYSLFDKASSIPGELKLKLWRAATAVVTAIIFGLIIVGLATEFGLLSGLFTFVFVLVSMWIVLPAGSIFWNYWAFYLPFLASAYLLADAARKNEYNSRKIYIVTFVAVLIKILFSGFDLTTTVLVMATVPYVFYGIYNHWDRKTFFTRIFKIGVVLLAAAFTGLVILSIQIIGNEGNVTSAFSYVLDRFGHHAEGSSEFFFNPSVEVRKITTAEVVQKYLVMPAVNVRFQTATVQILYWHLIAVFALFTIIYFLRHKIRGDGETPRKAIGLFAATWYSILAPLSWYVLFKPHSYIHTHVNTMGWQMPFTLLGFAVCGYVIADFFAGTQKALVNVPPLPASHTD